VDVKTKKTKRLKPLQPGIAPQMLRKLLTDNTQFANKKQQDAFEFAHFLFDQINVREIKGVDPTDSFKFQLEDRLQCSECKGVRYKTVKTRELSLSIPMEKLEKEKENKSSEKDGENKDGKEKEKKEKVGETKDSKEEYAPAPFTKIFDNFASTSTITEWGCPQCKKKTTAHQQTRLQTLPDILMVHLHRFVCPDWQPIKLDMDVLVDLEYDLGKYRGKGIQQGERELPGSGGGSTANVLKADPNIVSQLTGMGFSVPRSTRAALAVKNAGVNEASNWLFGNMDKDDLDNPLTPEELGEAPKSKPPSDDIPSELVASIESMGFETDRAKYALRQTKNNVERALDWLMSHMDDPLPNAPAPPTNTTSSDTKNVDTGSTNYRLVAVVTHRGKSTHSGHYVTHLLKEGKWILYNDNKVSLAEDPASVRKGYIYFFRRVGK